MSPVMRHRRRRTLELQVVGVHQALLDLEVAGDVVEREAFAEHVAEIERDPPRQRLQRQHAEQLADARIDLRELPGARLQREVAGQRRIVEVVRRAVPRELAVDLGRRVAHRDRITEAIEERAGVLGDERDVDLGGLPLAADAPPAAAVDAAGRIDERELGDPPIGSRRLREELELAEIVAARTRTRPPRCRARATCSSPSRSASISLRTGMQLVGSRRHEAREPRHHAAVGQAGRRSAPRRRCRRLRGRQGAGASRRRRATAVTLRSCSTRPKTSMRPVSRSTPFSSSAVDGLAAAPPAGAFGTSFAYSASHSSRSRSRDLAAHPQPGPVGCRRRARRPDPAAAARDRRVAAVLAEQRDARSARRSPR